MATPTRHPCTVLRLRKAARRTTRLYDRHLASSGLGIAQFGLLQTLRTLDGCTVTDLAAALDMDRTTMTRNLTPLIKQGLVELGNGADKRSRAVAITPAGRTRLSEAVGRWRAAQSAVRQALGGSEVDALHALLDAALERLPEA